MYGDVAPMETVRPSPDQLDAQASRLHDSEAWQQIVSGWEHTTPEPVLPAPDPQRPAATPSQPPSDWRNLLTFPFYRLIY